MIQCQFTTDHDGIPLPEEVAYLCSVPLAAEWYLTPPCQLTEKRQSTTQCEGLYLYLVATESKERQVTIELPPPLVWVSLEGCMPLPPENRCNQLPILVLSGEEPLPNEQILSIEGAFDSIPFTCDGTVCRLQLIATRLEGATVEFWANSSFGDTSERFTAQVRVIDTGFSPAPGESGWYVDVISSQWQGPPLASCARIWEAFPPVGGPPPWLSTPENHGLIATDEPYYYLAGRLIAQSLVDTTGCLNGGLLPNGYADVCGLERARTLVQEWQNQFDARLVEVARETGVPAQLMKNLFAQESQFWPGIFRVPYEFGLGQLTPNGADTILIWNPTFFQQFCPLILSEETCSSGYINMSTQEQAILRGALALQAKSDCQTCPAGVNLSNANFTVTLFANTLLANCSQVSRTIYNATLSIPGQVSSYEDLWRMTIANYHAGPGCLSYAIHNAWSSTRTLSWEAVSTFFPEPCKGAVPYVEKITR